MLEENHEMKTHTRYMLYLKSRFSCCLRLSCTRLRFYFPCHTAVQEYGISFYRSNILAVLESDYCVFAARWYEVPLPCRDNSNGRFKWSSFRGRQAAHPSPALPGALFLFRHNDERLNFSSYSGSPTMYA